MSEGSSSTKGFMILSLAGIFAKVLSAFYVPLLNKIIGVEGVGIYSRSYDIFMFVYAITSMGCQPAVAKVVAELRALGNERDAIKALKVSRKTYGIIGGALTIILMLLAYPIAKIGEIQNSTFAIMFLAPSIFLTAILSAYRGYFQGKNEMTGIAISQVLEQFLNIFISLLFAFLLYKISIQLGAAGGTIGTSIGAVIAIFYLIYVYDKKKFEDIAYNTTNHEKKVSSKAILRKLLRYALPITLSAGIQNFGGMIDMMNVSRRLIHAGFTQTQSDSLYGLLYNYKVLIGVPLIIVTALTTIVLPAVSRAYALRDRKAIRKNANFAFRIAFAITIPAAVGLAVLNNDVYTLLYQSDRGAYIMQYGSFILIFTAIAQLQSVILQGISQFYPMILSFSVGIILKIIANYILVGIPSINILGVLVGNFLCYLAPVIINHKILTKSIRYKIPLIRNCVKPIIASIVMAVVIIVLKQPIAIISVFIGASRALMYLYTLVYTLILVGIGGLVYLYIMIALGGIRKLDVEAMSPRIYTKLPRFIRKKLK
ncbi:polysaccharide biosynthesis protein [Clostridium sp.]|uniref:putative polysaccharide biosynthesis protein n=1 Tax=Clostridium sp. TaxID=1506 RepID=UPI002A91F422|nr:polysaccharide biosynthesis protein [Clostridium sp.]MDY6012677.1 polysaccharide biosynthesis protein [Clostridium sp.]